MFRSAREKGDLISARQLAKMLLAKTVSPDELFDVLIAGRYCVRVASIVEEASKTAEPFWAHHHVREDSPDALVPAVAPTPAVSNVAPRFNVIPVSVVSVEPHTAPNTTSTEVSRGLVEPVRAPNRAKSQASTQETTRTSSQESPVAKQYRSPAVPPPIHPQRRADVPNDFGALWQWQRLRQSPTPQHRALATAWARSVLDSHQEWLFVDTETTGLSSYDQVIELAVAKPVRHQGRWKLDPVLVQRMRPSVPISMSAALVHGITDRDLRHSPTFGDMADQIRSLLQGQRLLAWNAPFDRAALGRTVTSWQTSSVAKDEDWHCAMRAHAVWAGQSGGRMLYRYHKLGGDHSAMGDVERMLDRLVEMAEN